MRNETLVWQESMNEVTIDCSLDIAIHPANSSTVLLTIPGVDGSLDGYENKYIRMVELFQRAQDSAAVRMANPFITSHHWESNIRHVLSYISENTGEITSGVDNPRIFIVAHSAGAATIAKIASEYPEIQSLLLINPAKKLLNTSSMLSSLGSLVPNVTVVFGSRDPSVDMAEELRAGGLAVRVIDGADHNFSGDYLETFIRLPIENIG